MAEKLDYWIPKTGESYIAIQENDLNGYHFRKGGIIRINSSGTNNGIPAFTFITETFGMSSQTKAEALKTENWEIIHEKEKKSLNEKEIASYRDYNLHTRVDHPSHYSWLKEKCGVEVIDIARHMDFDLGNALKYILRCGRKQELGYSSKEKEIEDLKKAQWYIQDYINQLQNGVS